MLMQHKVKDKHPIKQGLKQLLSGDDKKIVNVKDKHPIKQGLKLDGILIKDDGYYS